MPQLRQDGSELRNFMNDAMTGVCCTAKLTSENRVIPIGDAHHIRLLIDWFLPSKTRKVLGHKIAPSGSNPAGHKTSYSRPVSLVLPVRNADGMPE